MAWGPQVDARTSDVDEEEDRDGSPTDESDTAGRSLESDADLALAQLHRRQLGVGGRRPRARTGPNTSVVAAVAGTVTSVATIPQVGVTFPDLVYFVCSSACVPR